DPEADDIINAEAAELPGPRFIRRKGRDPKPGPIAGIETNGPKSDSSRSHIRRTGCGIVGITDLRREHTRRIRRCQRPRSERLDIGGWVAGAGVEEGFLDAVDQGAA